MVIGKYKDDIFLEIIRIIQSKNVFQKKMIKNELASRDSVFWARTNSFSVGFETLMEEYNISAEKIADCYIKLCKDMVLEQIKFKKTGKYSSNSFAEVADRVYHSKHEMEAMVYGLAMSQFLWKNHYGLFDYFIETIGELQESEEITNYLEVGPGHGLHLVESLKTFEAAHFDVVDISSISLDLSKKVVKHFVGSNVDVSFHHQDIRDYKGICSYDLVVINEVLEHLEDPLEMMKCVVDLIGNNGVVFLTTCANAPSIDHIYLYDSVESIQDQINESGLEIITERLLPVGHVVPRSLWKGKSVEVNYGALCRKKISE